MAAEGRKIWLMRGLLGVVLVASVSMQVYRLRRIVRAKPIEPAPVTFTAKSRAALSAGLVKLLTPSLGAECLADWQKLIATGLDRFGDTPPARWMAPPTLIQPGLFVKEPIVSQKDRCDRLDPKNPLSAVRHKALEACATVSPKVPAQAAPCYRSLYVYQAAVVDFGTEGIPVPAIGDIGVLRMKYVAESERAQPDPRRLFHLAERMAAIEAVDPRMHRLALDAALAAAKSATGDAARQFNEAAAYHLGAIEQVDPAYAELPQLKAAQRGLASAGGAAPTR